MDRREYLTDKFAEAGLKLTDEAAGRFDKYAEMLVERNKVVNLTAITEFPDIVTKHFLDSVIPFTENVSRETFYGDAAGGDTEKKAGAAGKAVVAEQIAAVTDMGGLKVIDVGTGAGFPGIPLKIYEPSIKLTLLDSLDKRTRFLHDVRDALGLREVKIIHARAEDGARDPALRQHFDICVSRAVAALPVLCEYCLPYVRVGGYFLAYKAGDCEEEVTAAGNAVNILGGEIADVRRLILPGTDMGRSLIFIKKISDTPDKYPRKAGKPEKAPLV